MATEFANSQPPGNLSAMVRSLPDMHRPAAAPAAGANLILSSTLRSSCICQKVAADRATAAGRLANCGEGDWTNTQQENERYCRDRNAEPRRWLLGSACRWFLNDRCSNAANIAPDQILPIPTQEPESRFFDGVSRDLSGKNALKRRLLPPVFRPKTKRFQPPKRSSA